MTLFSLGVDLLDKGCLAWHRFLRALLGAHEIPILQQSVMAVEFHGCKVWQMCSLIAYENMLLTPFNKLYFISYAESFQKADLKTQNEKPKAR